MTVKLNVTSDEEWEAAVVNVVDKLGKFNILINSAGISTKRDE